MLDYGFDRFVLTLHLNNETATSLNYLALFACHTIIAEFTVDLQLNSSL